MHTVRADAFRPMGVAVAKRPTPIERAIAGEPADRRRRYDHRMIERGFKRMTLWVPPKQVDLIKGLRYLLTSATQEQLDQFEQDLIDYIRETEPPADWQPCD